MADEEDHPHLLKVLFPQERNMKKLSDSDFKRTLASYYHDSPSNIEIMNKAYQTKHSSFRYKKNISKRRRNRRLII
jgi:hypothetical protein